MHTVTLILRKKWPILASLIVLIGISGMAMFVLNPAPKVPTIAPEDSSVAKRPYVVKIHARWCPVCMLTKGSWTKLQTQYIDRVNLVVFDITNKETTEASRSEAKRLGLEAFFDEHHGDVGTVYVLDGDTKEVKSSVSGIRNLAEYVVAIDSSLTPTKN